MSCLYVVRCNFSDPTVVADWEHWYSGAKQDWLMSRPGFLAGQRFAAVSTTNGVEFLALYALESPAALETPEYRSGWGWGEWRPYIVDWSRNFFDGVDPAVFLTDEAEYLTAVFADPSADAADAALVHAGLTWVSSLPGLDGSLGAVGLARADAAATGEHVPGPGLASAVFRPASPPRQNEPGGTLGAKSA